ncbi:hypothetical protein PAXINDRAFT_6891 [Paxillus involutus ATCC 200175]|nr:hypothetical protein PAXINDRAFT_6891 [Paxillus involutus ATCC 200175]
MPSMARQHRRFDNASALFLPEPPPVFVLPGRQCFAQDPFALPQPYPHSPPTHPWDTGKEEKSMAQVVPGHHPALIVPYLVYLQQTEWLCLPTDIQATSPDPPACISSHNHSLTVTCVLFDRLEDITIEYGLCHPAPVVLVSWGLFPSFPVTPSIAVNLRVLELVKKVFVRMTPNTTAWCKALESFFDGQGYKLKTKDSLRRRFSQAFHWYLVLVISAEDYVSQFIHSSLSNDAGTSHLFSSSCCSDDVTKPSDYLRSRCPLCFGGEDWRESCNNEPDCIVCLDACFTQKCTHNPRNGAAQDPPNPTDTYHQRLFVLDNQVRHLDKKSLLGFGQWLVKKWDACQRKKEVAKEALRELDVDLNTLRQEWAAQVTHQTKPLPKCGGNKVAEEVEKILALEKLVESYRGHVAQLESDLTSDGKVNIVDYNMQLAEA